MPVAVDNSLSVDNQRPNIVRKRTIRTIMLLGVLAATPVAAQMAAAPVEEAPCRDVPPRPASVIAYFTSLLNPGAERVPFPVGEMQEYQVASKAAKAKDWANLCQYRADNLRLAAMPQNDRRVVYMGDSITELWGLADQPFFSGGRVNRGISGQTTGQMLVRFQSDVVALHPKTVHILAGINDIAGNEGPETLDDIRNNLIAMVTLAKANGIRVVLASITPAKKFPWKPALAPVPRIAALNAWLKSYAAKTGLTYVDYNALLAAPDGGMQPDLTFDGVHLNGAGYAKIRALSASATSTR